VIEGEATPKSAEHTAVAFYKSKARTDLAPERVKEVKVIRRYAVAVEK
jgi:uncharacterized protein YqeY